MKRVKKFFVAILGILAIPFIKIASVFGVEVVNTDIWEEGQKFINGGGNPTLYGVPNGEIEGDFWDAFLKIPFGLIFILVPVVVLGVRAYLDMKKKKQQQQNMNPNPQDPNNNTNNPNM